MHLLTSREYQSSSSNHDESIVIPWNQLLDIVIIAESTLILMFEVHHAQDGTCHFLEYLVGPCPAYSLKLLINDMQSTFELSRRVQFLSIPSSSSSLTASQKYVDENCLILLDVARLTKDAKFALSDCSSLMHDRNRASHDAGTLIKKSRIIQEDSAITSAAKNKHQTIDLSKYHSSVKMYEQLFGASASISQYFRMLVFLSDIICRTSAHMCATENFSVDLDELKILQRIKSDFESYEVMRRQEKPSFETTAMELSMENTKMNGKSDCHEVLPLSLDKFKHSDVYNVQYLLNEAFRWSFLLIMNSWKGHHIDALTQFSVVDFVIMSNKMKPPVASSISLVINGYYSRVGSILDHILKQPDDDSSTAVLSTDVLQDQLDLVHFLLAKEPIPGVLLNDVLGAIGVRFSRDVSVCKLLNEKFLLERLHDILHDLIGLHMKRIFATARKIVASNKDMDVSNSDNLDMAFPWEHSIENGEIRLSHLPQSIFDVLLTFTRMWMIVPEGTSPELHYHVDKMNGVICSEILGAYHILCKEVRDTVHSINDQFEKFNDTSFHLSTRDKMSIVSQLVQFLCSICNDVDQIISTHIPTLVSRTPCITTAMESLVHSTSQKLAGVSWLAAEMIAKTIFSGMGAMFLADLDDIQQRSPSAVEVMLATLEESLFTIQKHLLPFGYEQLLLSCENIVIQRFAI